jgi:3D (Asp-Asp-Asp) domain-containing protein
MKFLLLLVPGILCLFAGCAQTGAVSELGREFFGPPSVGQVVKVKTTAYVGKRNAVGRPLQYGKITSAASDWSEFPLGTRFRIVETGDRFIIDDYGSAMVGTRTIDLYMPHSRAMREWGTRNVRIEIEEWGSPRRSLEVLSPRENVSYVRRMLIALRKQSHGMPKQFHKVD